MVSLSHNSLATPSSLQVGFSAAVCQRAGISCARGDGIPCDASGGRYRAERSPPTEHAPQNDHNQPRGIVGTVWLPFTLLEQGGLFAQEEVLGSQCRRDRETSTRRRTRSQATQDSVVRLCASSWKMKPGMNAQLYTL